MVVGDGLGGLAIVSGGDVDEAMSETPNKLLVGIVGKVGGGEGGGGEGVTVMGEEVADEVGGGVAVEIGGEVTQ